MGEPDDLKAGGVQLLTHEFTPFAGGIAVYAEETARALHRLGAEVTVWAPDYGKPIEDDLPFQVQRIRMRGKQDWLCRWQMARALRRAYPGNRIPGTVVLAEPGPIRLWMYRRLMKLPQPERLVIILHGSEIQGLATMVHRRQRFRDLLRSADTVGVVSAAVEDIAVRLCPDIAGRLVRVPGAVRSLWQEFPAVERPEIPSRPDIIQVGRLHPRKGQHILIEAVSQLPEEVRQAIRIRLIGPVSRRRYAVKLRSMVHQYGLPVVFEGSISPEALREAFSTATLLAMPSQPFKASVEGLGLALLEAQHFGCPVIGSGTGGIGEALQDQVTGLLVSPGDPPALAQALQALLADPLRRKAMGTAGAAFVRRNFSWDGNARRLALV